VLSLQESKFKLIIDIKFHMLHVFLIINTTSYYCLQGKTGGLSAWEPAGAQEWLEVSIIFTNKGMY